MHVNNMMSADTRFVRSGDTLSYKIYRKSNAKRRYVTKSKKLKIEADDYFGGSINPRAQRGTVLRSRSVRRTEIVSSFIKLVYRTLKQYRRTRTHSPDRVCADTWRWIRTIFRCGRQVSEIVCVSGMRRAEDEPIATWVFIHKFITIRLSLLWWFDHNNAILSTKTIDILYRFMSMHYHQFI